MASITHCLTYITLVISTLSDALREDNSTTILEATRVSSIKVETSQNSTHTSGSTTDTNLHFSNYTSKSVEDIGLSKKSTTPFKLINIENQQESIFPPEVTVNQTGYFQNSPSPTSPTLTVAEVGLFQNLFLQKLGLTRPPTKDEIAKANFSRTQLYHQFPGVKGVSRKKKPRGYKHSDKRLSFTGTGKCYIQF